MMRTVQFAMSDAEYAASLQDALSRSGPWNVESVDSPDPALPFVLVLDDAAFERLPRPLAHPESIVLISRQDPQLLAQAWDGGSCQSRRWKIRSPRYCWRSWRRRSGLPKPARLRSRARFPPALPSSLRENPHKIRLPNRDDAGLHNRSSAGAWTSACRNPSGNRGASCISTSLPG